MRTKNFSRGSFRKRVLAVVARIPRGETLSYGQVAAVAGSANAYRAVGNIMKANRNPRIPCHRVIKSDGTAGGFNRGVAEKIKRLQADGVFIKRKAH